MTTWTKFWPLRVISILIQLSREVDQVNFPLATGFGDDVKKISRNMRPSLEGRREGDKFTVKWTADGKELVQIFELGVETEYSTLDGRKAKASEHSTIHAHLFEQVFF